MCKRQDCGLCLIWLLFFMTGVTHAKDPSLVAWWTFDEGTGPLAKDSSGNGNDARFQGAAAWVSTGKLGGALSFDGVAAYLAAPDSDSLDINGDQLSLTAWINGNGWPAANHVIRKIADTGTGAIYFIRVQPDTIRADLSTSGGVSIINGSRELATNEWLHVALSYDGAEARIFVNGELDVSMAVSGEITQSDNEVRIGRGEPAGYFDGMIDDARIYTRGVTQEEIQNIMLGDSLELAANPSPADQAADIQRTAILSWIPGEFALTHDVYIGTRFDDVNDAVFADAVSQGQDANSYDPGRLDFGQTYYWRVDEVNGAPDNTVFRGEIWSFTTESFSVPITNISVTASSSFGASVAENTINGSGLVDDLHGASAGDMWISAGVPASIVYAFDRAYRLHELWIWNSNQTIEPFVGFGAKDIVIEHSLDGENWTRLEGVGPLAQAPGSDGYAHNNTIDLGGAVARHVRLTVNSVQGFAPQASLSEVRFFHIPTFAGRPNPDSGAIGVAPDLTLSWGRNGREAARHDVYVGSDPNSLALAASVTESSFETLDLDLQLGETYAWRVDEVNEAQEPSAWTGDVWSFTTTTAIIVDDMERYKDEEFFEIWATWVDGFDDPGNGALVGNGATGSPETVIVHGGGQSLPLHYDNSAAPQSEATRIFTATQDWGKHGVQGLVLSFQGTPANTGGRLYVRINDSQIDYDGDPADLQRIGWHRWYIDLTQLTDATRGNVTSLTVGIDGGGVGVLYLDDILLTPGTRELITPTDPGPAGLVVHYPFDGDFQDASGNGLHGTGLGGAFGGPQFEPGHSGQAILLDGAGQYVEITGYQGISAVDGVQQPFSISNWFRTLGDGEMVTWGSSPGGQRLSWRVELGNLRTEHGNGNLRGNTLVNDGEWHHGALVVQEGANLRVPNTTLYIDGLADGVNAGDDDPYNLTPSVDVSIGRRATSSDRFFPGSIDEVRIYDRALNAAEVASLAGRTEPFDRP